MKLHADFVDDEVYPPEASAGGINAYYIDSCESVGHRPSYGVCLNKIACFEREGKLPPGMLCETEISIGKCPAIRMRQDEREAGRALFYVNRNKLKEFTERREKEEADRLKAKYKLELAERRSAANARLQAIAEKRTLSSSEKSSVKPEVKRVEKTADAPTIDYAVAINKALSEEAAKESTSVEMIQPIVEKSAELPKAGLSLIEMARQRLNKK